VVKRGLGGEDPAPPAGRPAVRDESKDGEIDAAAGAGQATGETRSVRPAMSISDAIGVVRGIGPWGEMRKMDLGGEACRKV